MTQELKSREVFDQQAYGWKLTKQSANSRVPPYIDLSVRVFRINRAEKFPNGLFGSVLLGVNTVVAKQHRHKCSAAVETFPNTLADIFRLVGFSAGLSLELFAGVNC